MQPSHWHFKPRANPASRRVDQDGAFLPLSRTSASENTTFPVHRCFYTVWAGRRRSECCWSARSSAEAADRNANSACTDRLLCGCIGYRSCRPEAAVRVAAPIAWKQSFRVKPIGRSLAGLSGHVGLRSLDVDRDSDRPPQSNRRGHEVGTWRCSAHIAPEPTCSVGPDLRQVMIDPLSERREAHAAHRIQS
jgi:hypothetical protein